MRENKPWTDTSIILETAPTTKKGRKGRRGRGRGRPAKKLGEPSTSTEPNFDPGKFSLVLNTFPFQES